MLRRQTERAQSQLDSVTRHIDITARGRNTTRSDRLANLQQRLENGRGRVFSDARRKTVEGRARLEPLGERLRAAFDRSLSRRDEALQRLDRMRISLGHSQTLKRGFAVIRDAEGAVVTTAAQAAERDRLRIEFADGELPVRSDRDPQGSLF